MENINLESRNKHASFEDYEFPKVSIVIPTYNSAEIIDLTVSSVLAQEYPDFELIIVDQGSTDRTLEVVQHHKDERVQIYSITSEIRYEILNKGISLAKGIYVNFLFPGDFYIYNRILYQMMEVALKNRKPDMVYCGTFLRDGRSEPKVMLRDVSIELLELGRQPTSLQACFFLTETLKMQGKFRTDFTYRGGYDLMCRLFLDPTHRAVMLPKVFVDYDLRSVTLGMVAGHFIETFQTIFTYFGLSKAIYWLFKQKDLKRIFTLWVRTLKFAFLGR